ncbi:choice-of-anchor A family protein [Streptomyces alkaliterrae]|uniref:choice-of-anchor A family protein n=1 Tax=Streptomyces alkaliterrae TaxID=2213162 RepID=UPI001E3971BF|nr:choice-of-anchor A family protein [Streptomyces alkaliterrae]
MARRTDRRPGGRWRSFLRGRLPVLVTLPLLLVSAQYATAQHTVGADDRKTARTADSAPGASHPGVRAPLPGGLGPCLGPACPDVHPPVNNDAIAGRDEAVNIFVGGDFRVRGGAAEAEGLVVTLGGFDQNKSRGGAAYNVGEVGVGSRVPPPAGSDWLVTGGDLTVADRQRLLAEGGVVRHGGTLTGTVAAARTVADPDATARYRDLRGELSDASSCYAHGDDGTGRAATGTAVNQGETTVFTGDGSSMLQVFNVDFDLVGPGGRQQGLRFDDIPAGATVLVNLLGTARTINTYSGELADTAPLNQLRPRLLWNFPDAGTVDLIGTGQFQGSVLIGNRDSQTLVTLPGVNGRFFTTGSVTHGGDTGPSGQEFHAYPFLGDLPDCAREPEPRGEVSVTKRDAEDEEPLAGAVFQLWRESNDTPGLQTGGDDPDTRVGDACVTDDDGRCADTVELGTYYWQELAPPDGYDLPDPAVFGPLVLTAENAADGVGVTAYNRETEEPQESGEVSVTKLDADTEEPLAGAVFQLWRETNGREGLQTRGANPDTRVGSTCETDAEGRCDATVDLGTYYWQEVTAPDGYDLPDPAVFGPLVLDEQGAVTGVGVTAYNRATEEDGTATLTVLKRDLKTGEPLPGAVFELWRETNGRPGLQTGGGTPDERVDAGCATDDAGECVFEDLPTGSYYLRETDVPEGYLMPLRPVSGPYALDAGQSESKTVTLNNRPGERDKGKGKGKRLAAHPDH